MNATYFVNRLAGLSFPNVFNPYRDCCSTYDHRGSAGIRRSNLARYLTSVEGRSIDAIWLGRDCGYRGGRRTGIALTDEFHLSLLGPCLGVEGVEKATAGAVVKERTATEIWKVLSQIDATIFLWNVFPFHPHEPENPLSNRRHTAAEYDRSKDLLRELIEWLEPKRLVTLGADAYREISKLGMKSVLVRHPSYGGHVEFSKGIQSLYRDHIGSERKVSSQQQLFQS